MRTLVLLFLAYILLPFENQDSSLQGSISNVTTNISSTLLSSRINMLSGYAQLTPHFLADVPLLQLLPRFLIFK
jgi:hypothetical protein